jgi:hypothetical protein
LRKIRILSCKLERTHEILLAEIIILEKKSKQLSTVERSGDIHIKVDDFKLDYLKLKLEGN